MGKNAIVVAGPKLQRSLKNLADGVRDIDLTVPVAKKINQNIISRIPGKESNSPLYITLLNTSEQMLFANKAVQIDTDFAGDNDNLYNEVYVCGRPVENEDRFWGVAMQDIPPGEKGTVQVGGVARLHVLGDYIIPYPDDASKVYCRHDFVTPGSDGFFHLFNRGNARVIWFDDASHNAVVMLNSRSYLYDGMFAVLAIDDERLLVKGGVTDLLKTSYARAVNVLEDTVIPIKGWLYDFTYVCLTGTRNSAGGWDIAVEQTFSHTFSDLYKPGEKIVWPLASYSGNTMAGHARALKQLHYGAVNFKERYYVE